MLSRTIISRSEEERLCTLMPSGSSCFGSGFGCLSGMCSARLRS